MNLSFENKNLLFTILIILKRNNKIKQQRILNQKSEVYVITSKIHISPLSSSQGRIRDYKSMNYNYLQG